MYRTQRPILALESNGNTANSKNVFYVWKILFSHSFSQFEVGLNMIDLTSQNLAWGDALNSGCPS